MELEGQTTVEVLPGVVRCYVTCDGTTGKAKFAFVPFPLRRIRRVLTRAVDTVTSYAVTLKGTDGRDLLNGRCAGRNTTGEQEELIYNPGTGTPIVTTNQDVGVAVDERPLTLALETPGTSKKLMVEFFE